MTELPRYPFTDDGLRDCLTELGTTTSAVVRNLVAMGVRGERGIDCESVCVLACYVHLALPAAGRVLVYLDDDDSEVYVVAERHLDGRKVGQIEAAVTGPLPTLVRLFDRGDFPELEVSDAA